jgi:HK97 family phage portal protein
MLREIIIDRVKSWVNGWGAAPIALDLKNANFGFDPVSLGEAAKRERLRGMLSSFGPSWSGENVTDETAMQLSTVWCCRRVISESIAMMPLRLMVEKNGEKNPARAHPLYNKLHYSPNPEMTTMSLRETMTDQMLAGGNAFAKIVRRSGSGTALELWPIRPEAVTIDRDQAKRLVYVVKDGTDKTYAVEAGKPQDVLHVHGLGSDGRRGYSVITMARQSMGTTLAAERHVGRFYARGGRLPYNLKLQQKWATTQQAEQFREDWNKIYSNPHEAPILEPNVEYQQTGLNFADAQLLESRQFSIPEICRWFLLTPHMVGDLSRATFSNIEQLVLHFVKFTLQAWITRWEQDFWRCVLTPEEQAAGYFLKHNVDGLLRGDFQARMAGFASALQNGEVNIDEVRDLEDRNPLPNGAGKAYHIQMNMATVPGTGEPTVAEQGILHRMAQGKGTAAAA